MQSWQIEANQKIDVNHSKIIIVLQQESDNTFKISRNGKNIVCHLTDPVNLTRVLVTGL